MRYLATGIIGLSLLVLTPPAQADEIEIEFRYHPDNTGRRTINQAIAAERDDDEYEIVLEGEGIDRRKKTKITPKQYDSLMALVRDALKRFTFEEGQDIDGPRVEVLLEYQSEDRELEITYIYPAGKVPVRYVKLQEQYFDKPYR